MLSNGAVTFILSFFKRILAIARMWAFFSLFLSSFILNSFASGFRSFIRWTSLIVALSIQAKMMLSADDKVSPENVERTNYKLDKIMIIQINPSLVSSDDNHFQQSSRPNKHKSYQELTLKTGTHSVTKR